MYKAKLIWSHQLKDSSSTPIPIYCITYSPTGSHLLATVSNNILVYSITGKLIHTLKGHTSTVYTIAYSTDSKRIASGSKDKSVILWNSEYEAILKYTHTESIQTITFNPMNSGMLISCSSIDYGMWRVDESRVEKSRVESRIMCSSWSVDGSSIALGLLNGSVLIISSSSSSSSSSSRIVKGDEPVWSLVFNTNSIIVLGSTLSLHSVVDYSIIGKESSIDGTSVDVCSEYSIVGGSTGSISMYSTDGVCVGVIVERMNCWIWSCKILDSNTIAVGSSDGCVSVYSITNESVYAFYREYYVYRECTNVIIQYNNQRTRIKCRECVIGVSVYCRVLAIQTTRLVLVYELIDTLTYKLIHKSPHTLCSMLIVTSKHFITCTDTLLLLYTFNGIITRQWLLDSTITFIKCTGGVVGNECILLGTSSGRVYKLFIQSPFPIPVYNNNTSVKCIDTSNDHTRIAIVDTNNTLSVYSLVTLTLLYQEPNVMNVVWNTECVDMVCYTSVDSTIRIKFGNVIVYTCEYDECSVVGFCGCRLYVVSGTTLTTLTISFTTTLLHLISTCNYSLAYSIACMGVTDTDWLSLAIASTIGLCVDVGIKCFHRLRINKYNDVLQRIVIDKQCALGDFYAFIGRLHDAASAYCKGNALDKAISMYSVLGMWDDAIQLADKSGDKSRECVLRDKANSLIEQSDWLVAASTFVEIGDYSRAVDIYIEHGMVDIIEIVRIVDAKDRVLQVCIDYFRREQHYAYLLETLLKVGDLRSVVLLHVELMQWSDALRVASDCDELVKLIALPFANWLVCHDKCVESFDYYCRAGELELGCHVLEGVGLGAVERGCFVEASELYCKLSDRLRAECVVEKAVEYRLYSNVYYAYSSIHLYLKEPFSVHQPTTLLNRCAYLCNILSGVTIPGIKLATIYYATTKLCRVVGAYKTARLAYEKLKSLKYPQCWSNGIRAGSVSIRAYPESDAEELHPLCFRCGQLNPIVNVSSNYDSCIHCNHVFIRSFESFSVLPLVRFYIRDGITREEAEMLIRREGGGRDLFGMYLEQWSEGIVLDRDALSGLKSDWVFIVKNSEWEFYKLIVESDVVFESGRFYGMDEMELKRLKGNV